VSFDYSDEKEEPGEIKFENNINLEEKNKSEPEKTKSDSGFSLPLSEYEKRVTKKPFGIYITPENSPVQLEKFSGFHTGTDFEIFPEELNKKVLVKSVCDGEIIQKRLVSGYGGVVVQICEVGDNSVIIIYGHLKLNGDFINIGDIINQSDTIGELGDHESNETNGERKHLHLGIKKGNEVDFSGYVSDKKELENWIDIGKLIIF
jgi:Peptidase family M23